MEEATVISMHAENRKDIAQLRGQISEVQAEQARAAGIQQGNQEKLDRLSFILEGDGNGNIGIVRKFDASSEKIDSLTKTRDDLVEWAVRARGLLWTITKWAAPIILAWIISWFSIPQLRHFVNQFTLGDPPAHNSNAAPQITDNPGGYHVR
jgi:hypothetical protein